MKIRTGFVSNSSSASFVITVNLTPNKFKKLLATSYFPNEPFDEVSFLKSIKKKLKSLEKLCEKDKIELQKTKKKEIKALINLSLKGLENEVESLKYLIERIINKKDIIQLNEQQHIKDVVQEVLEYNNITTSFYKNKVILNYYVSMLNDFSSSLSPLLKEILFILLFGKIKVICMMWD